MVCIFLQNLKLNFSSENCNSLLKYVVVPAIAIGSLTFICKTRKQYLLRKKWNDAGKDIVVLHQFNRGKFCPNLSPFAVKLECYFRFANISYVVDSEQPFGPKGKCPWITFNGEDFSDSEVIISILSDYFKPKAMDTHLSTSERATLEAVRVLVEEHLFWCVVTWRYWLDRCESFMKSQSFSPFMAVAFPIFMPSAIKPKALVQGMGRHTPHQIYNFCEKDCSVLADILGNKPFFGGHSPSVADCAIFGGLSQLMWNAPDSIYEAIITDLHPTLESYCLRMKEKFFPDWSDLLVD